MKNVEEAVTTFFIDYFLSGRGPYDRAPFAWKKEANMELIEISEELEELGTKMIREHEDLNWIAGAGIDIGYQYSSKPKTSNGKIVYADCYKVPDRLKAYVQHNFIITFYEPNTASLRDDQKEILMYHELLHVGMKETKEGPKYHIVHHDIEDFERVIKQYGVDWAR